jgi:hypothetical protein
MSRKFSGTFKAFIKEITAKSPALSKAEGRVEGSGGLRGF